MDIKTAGVAGDTACVISLNPLLPIVFIMSLIGFGWLGPVDMVHCAESSASKPTSKIPNPLASQGLFKFWNFDQQPAGEAPAGFAPRTVGAGEPGNWKIEREHDTPSAPNRLTQTTPCPTDGCFQMLLAEGLTYDYFDVAVRIRPSEGSQGEGGMVFGMKNGQNFYAAIAKLEASTVEVIRMLNGTVTVLKQTPVQHWKMPWHLLRVRRNTIMSKEYLEVFFDNAQIFSLEEKTLNPGQIGLVTTGKAVIAFDNLNAAPLYSQKPLSPPAAY
jgi:hypothetical protein